MRVDSGGHTESDTVASRAPSSAALAAWFHWKRALPNSTIPKVRMKNSGAISVNSTSVAPVDSRSSRPGSRRSTSVREVALFMPDMELDGGKAEPVQQAQILLVDRGGGDDFVHRRGAVVA